MTKPAAKKAAESKPMAPAAHPHTSKPQETAKPAGSGYPATSPKDTGGEDEFKQVLYDLGAKRNERNVASGDVPVAAMRARLGWSDRKWNTFLKTNLEAARLGMKDAEGKRMGYGSDVTKAASVHSTTVEEDFIGNTSRDLR